MQQVRQDMNSKAAQSLLSGARRVAQRGPCAGCYLRYGPRWSSTLERKWSTPLAKTLTEAITTTGPVSIASFMRQCLTSDLGGYYTRQQQGDVDQFGKTGDFVTSPEISQIFGELVGIWFLTEWMSQRKGAADAAPYDHTHMVELGPGRGTLMSDVLRVLSRFTPMANSIEKIYLVEASQALREAQARLLCTDDPLKPNDIGFVGKCKLLPRAEIVWTEDVSFLPQEQNKARFVVAHEFFDALPIHAFISTASKPAKPNPRRPGAEPSPLESAAALAAAAAEAEAAKEPQDRPRAGNQWHELLVNPTAPPSPFDPPSPSPESRPEFELVTSSGPTRHSQLLSKLSPRYAEHLQTEGATIEVSPAARTAAARIAELIAPANSSSSAGAALIVDYGPAAAVPANTLRGVRAHARVPALSTPGATDVSADVDFGALVEAVLEASAGVEAHGPVTQGAWLSAMGGRERLEALVRRASDPDTAQLLRDGWARLTESSLGHNEAGMGDIYKVLAVVPDGEGRRRPVGFGGGVQT